MARRGLLQTTENTHPYQVHLALTLGNNVELQLDAEEVELTFSDTLILRVRKRRLRPREEANDFTPLELQLFPFASAAEAERAGRLLIFAMLWFAASKGISLSFQSNGGDYPFEIRDRRSGSFFLLQGEGRFHSNVMPTEFCTIAGVAFSSGIDIDPHLMTSMEFYASARMEATETACFIGLMTAIEALATQRDLGDEIGEMLQQLETTLRADSRIEGSANESIRNSLCSQITNMRRESVRRAIRRTIRELVDDEDTLDFLEEAYSIRSKILHEGMRTRGLHPVIQRLEAVLRLAYAAKLGLGLAAMPPIFSE